MREWTYDGTATNQLIAADWLEERCDPLADQVRADATDSVDDDLGPPPWKWLGGIGGSDNGVGGVAAGIIGGNDNGVGGVVAGIVGGGTCGAGVGIGGVVGGGGVGGVGHV